MIDGRTLAVVRDALTLAETTEADFRNAGVSIANQVDANQVDLIAPRNIALTGDVHGNMDFVLDVDRNVSIMTTIQAMSVSGEDIATGSITSLQIEDGTVTNTDIAATSKQSFSVLDADGNSIFTLDALLLVP